MKEVRQVVAIQSGDSEIMLTLVRTASGEIFVETPENALRAPRSPQQVITDAVRWIPSWIASSFQRQRSAEQNRFTRDGCD